MLNAGAAILAFTCVFLGVFSPRTSLSLTPAVTVLSAVQSAQMRSACNLVNGPPVDTDV